MREPRRAKALKEIATSLEYNLNNGDRERDTTANLANASNPNWIKEVGYEIQFAAGTFNASDWVDKTKAPGLITLDDPGRFAVEEDVQGVHDPELHVWLRSAAAGTRHQLAAWDLGALSLLWFARRRRDAVTPTALRRLLSS